jgi:hypothetical protein
MLVEGHSLRATTRMAGCSINTDSKLIVCWYVGDRKVEGHRGVDGRSERA